MTPITRVLICGSRDWTDRAFFDLAMARWIERHGMPNLVIEGCARGADAMAEDWANAHGPDHEGFGSNPGDIGPLPAVVSTIAHFPAQWETHDSYNQTCWCPDKSVTKCRGAGPLRNQAMLEAEPHAVIAFTRDLSTSRGTADMVRRARAAGVRVWLPVAGSDR